jgi:hypothetical protein
MRADRSLDTGGQLVRHPRAGEQQGQRDRIGGQERQQPQQPRRGRVLTGQPGHRQAQGHTIGYARRPADRTVRGRSETMLM